MIAGAGTAVIRQIRDTGVESVLGAHGERCRRRVASQHGGGASSPRDVRLAPASVEVRRWWSLSGIVANRGAQLRRSDRLPVVVVDGEVVTSPRGTREAQRVEMQTGEIRCVRQDTARGPRHQPEARGTPIVARCRQVRRGQPPATDQARAASPQSVRRVVPNTDHTMETVSLAHTSRSSSCSEARRHFSAPRFS